MRDEYFNPHCAYFTYRPETCSITDYLALGLFANDSQTPSTATGAPVRQCPDSAFSRNNSFNNSTLQEQEKLLQQTVFRPESQQRKKFSSAVTRSQGDPAAVFKAPCPASELPPPWRLASEKKPANTLSAPQSPGDSAAVFKAPYPASELPPSWRLANEFRKRARPDETEGFLDLVKAPRSRGTLPPLYR